MQKIRYYMRGREDAMRKRNAGQVYLVPSGRKTSSLLGVLDHLRPVDPCDNEASGDTGECEGNGQSGPEPVELPLESRESQSEADWNTDSPVGRDIDLGSEGLSSCVSDPSQHPGMMEYIQLSQFHAVRP